jgi:hypothetical protein
MPNPSNKIIIKVIPELINIVVLLLLFVSCKDFLVFSTDEVSISK